MSGVEPALLIAAASAAGTVASTALSMTQGGPDIDPVAPAADDDDLTADSNELARRRALIRRRRGTESLSLSVDPATGTGMDI